MKDCQANLSVRFVITPKNLEEPEVLVLLSSPKVIKAEASIEFQKAQNSNEALEPPQLEESKVKGPPIVNQSEESKHSSAISKLKPIS